MRKNLLGCHVSMSAPNYLYGSALEAINYGANTFMVYLGAPQNSKRVPVDKMKIEEFIETLRANNIETKNVVVHAPYIVNMATEDQNKKEFARTFLINEIRTMNSFGATRLVLHPGNFLNLTKEKAIENIIESLNFVIEKTENAIICLEYMAGKGTEVCTNFEEIKRVIDGVYNKKRIGVCLDTCHMNDSGVDTADVEKILNEFDKKIGLNFLNVIHINDSMNDIGSKKDRHQNIGQGKIGLETLKKWVQNEKLVSVPKILETPYIGGKPPYKEEIIILLEE